MLVESAAETQSQLLQALQSTETLPPAPFSPKHPIHEAVASNQDVLEQSSSVVNITQEKAPSEISITTTPKLDSSDVSTFYAVGNDKPETALATSCAKGGVFDLPEDTMDKVLAAVDGNTENIQGFACSPNGNGNGRIIILLKQDLAVLQHQQMTAAVNGTSR
jgi:hypothetical protein